MIERAQFYVAKLLGSGQNNVTIQTDSDAPFRLFGLAFYTFGSGGGAQGAAGNVSFKVRFTKPDGTSWFQRNLVNALALNPFDNQATNGAGGLLAPVYSYASAIHPNFLYAPQSTIVFDFADVPSASTSRIYAVMIGVKLFNPEQVWSPSYPAKFRALPFFGFSVQVPLTGLPVLNIPVPPVTSASGLNADADFVWQCGAYTAYLGAGATPVPAPGIGVKMRDWVGKPYMNDYVPIDLLFGFDNSQRPGLVYPEIYIPKNQQIFVDLAAL